MTTTMFTSPLSDFKQEVEAAGLEDRVHYLSRGESYRFNASPVRTKPQHNTRSAASASGREGNKQKSQGDQSTSQSDRWM